MISSRAAKALAVRRVTQDNKEEDGRCGWAEKPDPKTASP